MATSHRSAKSDAARIAHLWRQTVFEKKLKLLMLLAFCSLFWMWKGEIAKMLHDDRHKLSM